NHDLPGAIPGGLYQPLHEPAARRHHLYRYPARRRHGPEPAGLSACRPGNPPRHRRPGRAMPEHGGRMTQITDMRVEDIRFPTSAQLDGSDAMNPDPDYSAAYVILETDQPDLCGHGLTFT